MNDSKVGQVNTQNPHYSLLKGVKETSLDQLFIKSL